MCGNILSRRKHANVPLCQVNLSLTCQYHVRQKRTSPKFHDFQVVLWTCGPQSISVADKLGDKLHQENTIFGTSTSFLFYLHHSHHCPLKMGFIITFHHYQIQTWTILLEVMKALPLSMIGSMHCEVFFGNTNFSTHDPSKSLT